MFYLYSGGNIFIIGIREKMVTTHNMIPKIIICIPAYNEEKHIGPIILKTLDYCEEIIVCNDGSDDLTGEIASKLGAHVIHHKKNRGYGAAIISLFKEAIKLNADIVVTLDGDGQHDPKDIPQLVNKLDLNSSDIIIGSRFVEGAYSEASSLREKGIKFITKLVSKNNEITDAQSGIRAYNRKAIESLTLTENGMGVSTEILVKASKLGLKISEVPVSVYYGIDNNEVKKNPMIHGIDVILSTIKHISINRPMVFYGLPGFISLFISLFFWLWNLDFYSKNNYILTNVAIVAIGTSIIGFILLTTAMILWVVITVIREKDS